jgi:short-subunit dehydrogenase
MQARGRGGVVFVASTAAYQPTPSSAVYGAAKAFELSFGIALWAELHGTGVDVLVLSPGETATEFQAVSGFDLDSPGGSATPEAVVGTALRALGRTPAAIHGVRNRLLALLARLLPTPFVARMALRELSRAIRPR